MERNTTTSISQFTQDVQTQMQANSSQVIAAMQAQERATQEKLNAMNTATTIANEKLLVRPYIAILTLHEESQ